MKRRKTISLLMCSLLLTACNSRSIGIIGGADGPTSIFVSENGGNISGQLGEQYEKRPVRMFNIDGDLYYDSGLVSDMTPRCGTLDGELKKTVRENEIPLKSGEANFDTDGYQHATGITKEVNVDGKWVIFRKYDMLGKDIEGLKYCHYIKGHLNNAAADSEIIVLSEKENVTFSDVYEPLLSSQYPADKGNGHLIHNVFGASDKWGVTLYSENVTKTGMTLKIEQFGGNHTGDLQTGEWYKLEKTVGDNWQEVETNPLIDYAWNMVAYGIKKNDITEFKVEWEWLYGKLSPGYYRLSKEIMDFRATGDYDKEIYEVYFTIE